MQVKKYNILILCASLLTMAIIPCLGQSDTSSVNIVDGNGKKQGRWILTNKMIKSTCGDENQKMQEGAYLNSRKNGLWKSYYCNRKLKSEIKYTNNRPNGYAIVYHPNGQVKEEGEWKNNRWIGTYIQYYSNGNVQHKFNFNEVGKREGTQEYFHSNGELQITGNWAEGKEAGELKEYYANGDLRSIKTFNGGAIDASKTKKFEVKKPLPEIIKLIEEEIAPPPPPVVVAKAEKVNLGRQFDGEGYWQLYNSNRQVTKDGTFKKNRLINGKAFHYDEDGILKRIAIYRGGRYIGDGVMGEEASAE